jgi:hypothetical protein
MSVVQPRPGIHEGSEGISEQPMVAKLMAKAATSDVRLMSSSGLMESRA